jgi:hypothetical protein
MDQAGATQILGALLPDRVLDWSGLSQSHHLAKSKSRNVAVVYHIIGRILKMKTMRYAYV